MTQGQFAKSRLECNNNAQILYSLLSKTGRGAVQNVSNLITNIIPKLKINLSSDGIETEQIVNRDRTSVEYICYTQRSKTLSEKSDHNTSWQ